MTAHSSSLKSNRAMQTSISGGSESDLLNQINKMNWVHTLEDERRKYFLSLFDDKIPIAQITIPYEDISNKTLLIDKRADHVFIRLRIGGKYNGYVRICVSSSNEFDIELESFRMGYRAVNGEVIAVLPKPSSQKFWWKAETIEQETDARITEAELRFYESGGALPLGAGAAFFDRTDDIPRAAKELVDFYPHHKAIAEKLRNVLRPRYEPKVLIENIEVDAFEGETSRTKAPEGATK